MKTPLRTSVAWKSVARTSALTLALTLAAGLHPAGAQSRWSWPEESENLRVLPKDMGARALRATMTGFSRALGVRCSHCHVGQEGAAFSEWNFSSDENPNKDRAREMMKMLGGIREQLGSIDPSGAAHVEMTCASCHRGTARPMRLPDALWETYHVSGADATVSEYHALRTRYHGRGAYDFAEGSLNELGYRVLDTGDHAGAAALLGVNAELFPSSTNAWDSLAEAHLAMGDTLLARTSYEKALDLDPTNANAKKKLEELGAR